MKPRRARLDKLRSMRWLAVRGFGYRLRAALLLLSFAIGSIVARDAALLHHLQRFAGVTIELARESGPAVGEKRQPPKLQWRPSGISKRTAWSPTDPPEDDDQLDDDSDTLAAHFGRALPVAAAIAVPSIGAGVRAPMPCVVTTSPPKTSISLCRQRGPPV